MPITPDQLAGIWLAKGAHNGPEEGICLLEAVAYLQGEPWSDRPACVSPILGEFGRRLNDHLPADTRQRLVPLIPLLPGTAGDGHDEARGYLALDWLVRTFTPAWLDLAGLKSQSEALRGLDQIVDLASARLASPVVREIQEEVALIRATVEDAAEDAAGDIAWDTDGDATNAAARAVAWDTAGAAAGDIAWDAAWDAADVAWAAAWDAAWDAAEVAAGRDTTWVKLMPTVRQLQNAAVDLYHRMIVVQPDRIRRTS